MTGFKSKKAAALDEEGFYTVHPKDEDDDIQVYQRPWVGLTDEEVDTIYQRNGTHKGFAKAIEAKLKEKNSG
jgi:formaldehyde-activating enzyme involved in methanogenesis